MMGLSFYLPSGRPLRLMFIGAHSDDIEIGCGATVLELASTYPQLEVHWLVLSASGTRAHEARLAADALLSGKTRKHIQICDFRESYFPSVSGEIKDFFEKLKSEVAPDIIFTHHRDDLHQDHRVAAEITWNTWRDNLILEYEVPKYDGGLGSPGVFCPISEANLQRKVTLLTGTFASQKEKRWFTPSTFEGLARIRGIECNAPSGYAEAFYCRKLVLAGH